MAETSNSLLSVFFPSWARGEDSRKRLRNIAKAVRHSTGEENFYQRLLQAVRLTETIRSRRNLPKEDPLIPLSIAEMMAQHAPNEPDLEAAILASFLQRVAAPEDLKTIGKEFGPEVADSAEDMLHTEAMNYLPRLQVAGLPETAPPQTEAERQVAFVHMVKEKIRSRAAMLQRLCNAYVQLYDKANIYEQTHGVPPEERDAWLYQVDHFYIPLAEVYNFQNLKDDFADQRLRLWEPARFRETERIILEAEEAVLHGRMIDNERGRRVAVFRDTEKRIRAILPKELQYEGVCTFEFRRKRVAALHKKLIEEARKGKDADTSDIFGFRIIVKAPEDYYGGAYDINYVKNQEYVLLLQIVKALASPASPFKSIDRRFKNYVKDPTGASWDFVKDSTGTWVFRGEPLREDNGYGSIHMTVQDTLDQKTGSNTNPTKREIHLVGWAMHDDNTNGTAAHYIYKRSIRSFLDAANEVTNSTVSVYGPGNQIYRLPYGATIADLAVMVGGPDYTFSAEPVLRRIALHDPVSDVSLKIRLVTGDQINFSHDGQLLRDPKHTWEVAMACQSEELRSVLLARHYELAQNTPNPQVALLPPSDAAPT